MYVQYPEWLKRNREQLSADEYARYEKQYRYCLQIIQLFDQEDDDGSGGEKALKITGLMQQMQDCGAPPPEILQQLAPGLELGADGLPQQLPTAGDCPVQ